TPCRHGRSVLIAAQRLRESALGEITISDEAGECGNRLEGSVRKADGRVRITAQLIEAETATHLPADRFEGPLEDVCDLQAQVAISVAGGIEPAVRTAEIRRALDRPRRDPTAYDLYLRSLRATVSWEKNDYLEGLEWLSQAIKQGDTYGPALAVSAIYHMALNQNAWVGDPEAARQKGYLFGPPCCSQRWHRCRDARSSRMGPRLRGRGYRCRNSPYGSIVTSQSELRPRMAMERVVEIVGGFPGYGDRSSR